MTKKELIEALEEYPDDTPILSDEGYGSFTSLKCVKFFKAQQQKKSTEFLKDSYIKYLGANPWEFEEDNQPFDAIILYHRRFHARF